MSKLVLIILLSSIILQISVPLRAQNLTPTQRFTKIKLYELIELIGKKFETSFSYNPQMIPNTEIKSLSLEGKNLEDLLKEVLNPLNIKYTIEGKTVAIFYIKDKNQNQGITVAGKVIDKITKEPIPGVNVYISKTLSGTSTNINGEFKFTLKPNEKYEIVASHVSYQPFTEILSSIKNTSNIVIELEENIQKLDELVIRSPSSKDWKNYLRIFKREFIGTSKYANKCEIMNPEVIYFEYDSNTGLLKAYSDELLIIKNESLGYKVSHLLVFFEFQYGQVKYVSKPKFDYLTTDNRKQELKWEKNRKEVYTGSFDHFIQSLIDNTLRDEGFSVSSVSSLGDDRIYESIKRDEILKDQGSTKVLAFDNYLEVQHKQLEDRDYQHYRLSIDRKINVARMSFERQRQQYQTSILELTSDQVIIKENYLLNPMSLIQHGYWGWKRNSDLLPYNYMP